MTDETSLPAAALVVLVAVAIAAEAIWPGVVTAPMELVAAGVETSARALSGAIR